MKCQCFPDCTSASVCKHFCTITYDYRLQSSPMHNRWKDFGVLGIRRGTHEGALSRGAAVPGLGSPTMKNKRTALQVTRGWGFRRHRAQLPAKHGSLLPSYTATLSCVLISAITSVPSSADFPPSGMQISDTSKQSPTRHLCKSPRKRLQAPGSPSSSGSQRSLL